MARALAPVIAGRRFCAVLTSPLRRARETCDLVGLGAQASVEPALLEWNYGQYEGITTAEIKRTRPDWDLWRHGCPGGESLEDVAGGTRTRIRSFTSSATTARGIPPMVAVPSSVPSASKC